MIARLDGTAALVTGSIATRQLGRAGERGTGFPHLAATPRDGYLRLDDDQDHRFWSGARLGWAATDCADSGCGNAVAATSLWRGRSTDPRHPAEDALRGFTRKAHPRGGFPRRWPRRMGSVVWGAGSRELPSARCWVTSRMEAGDGLDQSWGGLGRRDEVLGVGCGAELGELGLDVADRGVIQRVGDAIPDQLQRGDVAGDVAGVGLVAAAVDHELSGPPPESGEVDVGPRSVLAVGGRGWPGPA